MKCLKCQTDNPHDSKFCEECATPLPYLKEAVAVHTEKQEAYKDFAERV